jgi:2-phosphoglycolate phosphatase
MSRLTPFPPRPLSLVLFDLDGTLADTAPDLAAAANRQRIDHGLAPLPYPVLRPYASQGARGLIGRALDVGPDDARFEPLREQFLAYYEAALCVESRLFDGVQQVLDALAAHEVRWGIVTNKAARFTTPLVAQLGLSEGAACVVSGDTTPHAKPHPEPLRHAMRSARAQAATSLYVGDDRRDIQAGRAAGVATVAAAYGYLGDDGDTLSWQADHTIGHPLELLDLLPRAAAR